MPTYDYVCPNDHVHERFNVPENDREPRICPECLKKAYRAMSFTGKPVVRGGTPKFHREGTR